MASFLNNDLEEELFMYVENYEQCNVERLLEEGADASKISKKGRSAIGHATAKGFSDILKILLISCDKNFDDNKVTKSESDWEHMETTPEGMDGLQWEEEIQVTSDILCDDEWSRLYRYYARMIEKTGDILTNNLMKFKDPHGLDSFHHAPIHYAAINGNYKCMEILLNARSPVEIATYTGMTPLHLSGEHPAVTDLLLKYKADPNKRTFNSRETPLHIAVREGHPSTIAMLINAGADINATCRMERTPLLLAIYVRNVTAAKILIDYGAKLNVQDNQGLTPLYGAVLIEDYSLIEYLLTHGARLYVSHYLLHYAIQQNLFEIAKLLIIYGDNVVNVRDPSSGRTPLYLAIQERNVDLITLLIKNGAQINRDGFMMKELHIALQDSQTFDDFQRVAQTLLINGVDIDKCNHFGESPLLQAIIMDKLKIAEFLVKEGANVTHCLDGLTSLILIRKINLNIFKILVYAGLNIQSNRPNNIKSPPWTYDPNDTEDYLGIIYSNPLSLQSLCRITIRNKLIGNMKNFRNNYNCDIVLNNNSILKTLLAHIGLPRLLQNYLYDFPDVPPIIIDDTNVV